MRTARRRTPEASSDTRNQHHVPQVYHRGFSNYVAGQERKAKVFTVDLERRKQFTTLVRNVGAVRDWNHVEAKGVDPHYGEKALSELESEFKPAVSHVEKTRSLDGEAKDVILNFIALFSARHPHMREQFRKFIDTVTRRIAKISLSTEEQYNAYVKRQIANGELSPDTALPFEEMKRFMDSDAYKIEVTQEFNLSVEFGLFDKLLDYVSMREWSLALSGDNSWNFVTSDKPVTLVPTKEPMMSIGHAHTHSAVVFPLTRHIAMMGKYDEPAQHVTASQELVAAYNIISIRHAHTQVYAPDDTFEYMRDHRIFKGSELSRDKGLVRLKNRLVID